MYFHKQFYFEVIYRSVPVLRYLLNNNVQLYLAKYQNSILNKKLHVK